MLTDLPAANVDNEAVKMNPCRDAGNNGETKSSQTFDNCQINYITSRPKHHYRTLHFDVCKCTHYMQNASNNNKQCFEKYVLTVCL